MVASSKPTQTSIACTTAAPLWCGLGCCSRRVAGIKATASVKVLSGAEGLRISRRLPGVWPSSRRRRGLRSEELADSADWRHRRQRPLGRSASTTPNDSLRQATHNGAGRANAKRESGVISAGSGGPSTVLGPDRQGTNMAGSRAGQHGSLVAVRAHPDHDSLDRTSLILGSMGAISECDPGGPGPGADST